MTNALSTPRLLGVAALLLVTACGGDGLDRFESADAEAAGLMEIVDATLNEIGVADEADPPERSDLRCELRPGDFSEGYVVIRIDVPGGPELQGQIADGFAQRLPDATEGRSGPLRFVKFSEGGLSIEPKSEEDGGDVLEIRLQTRCYRLRVSDTQA